MSNAAARQRVRVEFSHFLTTGSPVCDHTMCDLELRLLFDGLGCCVVGGPLDARSVPTAITQTGRSETPALAELLPRDVVWLSTQLF